MPNHEQDNSVRTTSFSNTGKKSKSTWKRLAKIIGVVVVATAVGFGGGTALSQFPTSVAQISPAQPLPATTSSATTTAAPATSKGLLAVSAATDEIMVNRQRDKGRPRDAFSDSARDNS